MRPYLTVLVVDAPRIVRVLAAITVALVFLSVTGQIIKFIFGHGSVYGFVLLFSLDDEFNVPSFFSGLLLIFCSVLLAESARLTRMLRQPFPNFWRFLAAIFLYLAFDEMVSIHERLIVPLRNRFDLQGPFWFAWVVVAIPIVVLFAAASIPFLRSLTTRARALFVLAGIVYVGGALGMEMFGSWYTHTFGGKNLTYSMITTAEEFLEMAGVIVFVYALLDRLSMVTPVFRVVVEDSA